MLTIKKRGRSALAFVAAACLLLTGCAPPGIRALHKGDRLVQAGKYDAAIEALTEAINLIGKDELEPQAKAHNLLGLAYHGKGNAARARACYLQALDLDKLDKHDVAVEADYNLGCLEMQQNNLGAAKEDFITYTALRGQDWDGYMKLATVNYRLATNSTNSDNARRLNFGDAKKAFDAANHIKPTPEAWNSIAMIDLAMVDLQHRTPPSRLALSNVVAEFRAALACDSNYAPALLNLAVVYDPASPYKFGDIQSATNAYRRYLAVTPPPAHAAEIALLVTNMDKRERVMVQYPGQAPESPVPITTPSTNRGVTIIRTNPPSPPPAPAASNSANTNLLAHPLPVPVSGGSNSQPVNPLTHPSPPPAPIASNSQPPVSPIHPTPPPAPAASNTQLADSQLHPAPAPGPAGPSRPRGDNTASPSNTAALPTRGLPLPAISNTAVAPTNAATAKTNAPVEKPSWLARLFGKKPKPAATGAGAAAGTPAFVTPLPAPTNSQPADSVVHPWSPPTPPIAPDGGVHYAAPAFSTDSGDRAEAERLVKEGAAAEKESRLKAAVTSYEKAVKADPSYFDACEALGMAAIKSEEYAVALDAFHHALALNPESPNARYDYAWALEKKEYFQDAANELEKLLARHPNETRAHLLLGNLYAQKLGQPDFARGHYKKVLEQDPSNGQAPSLRAWLQSNPEP